MYKNESNKRKWKRGEEGEEGEEGAVEEKQTVVTASVTPPRYSSDDELDNGIKLTAVAVSEAVARKELEEKRA